MDQLYFYVRKMDELISTLKDTLNQTEEKYSRQTGPNLDTKITNYFLHSKEKTDIQSFLKINDDNNGEDSDNDSSVTEEGSLNDDMESDEETDDGELAPQDNKCGSCLERAWIRRSKALRTDIAIAGWMCSPITEIMEDSYSNNNGEHRIAVTRLLRKWYIHKVCFI